MKYRNKFAFLFSFSALAYIGCSSSTTPNPTPTPTPSADSVSYKTATNYKYVEHPRDTADKNTTVTDTITSTVKSSGQVIDDKSGVTVIENTHSNGSVMDSTDIAQSNGEFWHHNFGLEGFEGFLKGSLGWVLQAKLNAKADDTWVAKPPTNVMLTVFSAQVSVTVNATEMADTTIMVGTESVAVKHVKHVVSISPGNISSNIDTYVSPKYGIVATVRHSTRIDVQGAYTGPVPGAERVMVSHP